jgi:hypothetical protein
LGDIHPGFFANVDYQSSWSKSTQKLDGRFNVRALLPQAQWTLSKRTILLSKTLMAHLFTDRLAHLFQSAEKVNYEPMLYAGSGLIKLSFNKDLKPEQI